MLADLAGDLPGRARPARARIARAGGLAVRRRPGARRRAGPHRDRDRPGVALLPRGDGPAAAGVPGCWPRCSTTPPARRWSTAAGRRPGRRGGPSAATRRRCWSPGRATSPCGACSGPAAAPRGSWSSPSPGGCCRPTTSRPVPTPGPGRGPPRPPRGPPRRRRTADRPPAPLAPRCPCGLTATPPRRPGPPAGPAGRPGPLDDARSPIPGAGRGAAARHRGGHRPRGAQVRARIGGLGPLEPLLADPRSATSWSTGRVRSGSSAGRLERTEVHCSTGRRSTCWSSGSWPRWACGPTATPVVDARLPDGSRVTWCCRRWPSTARWSPSAGSAPPPSPWATFCGPASPGSCLRRHSRPQHGGVGGTGRQDHPAQRAVPPPAARERVVTSRTPPSSGSGRPRGPAGVRRPPRRPRRGRRPRPRRAASACDRTDRRRRGPRRRGPRHAPGDEHRARRLPVDVPRQRPGRCAPPRRDDGPAGGAEVPSMPCATRSSARSTWSSTSPGRRRRRRRIESVAEVGLARDGALTSPHAPTARGRHRRSRRERQPARRHRRRRGGRPPHPPPTSGARPSPARRRAGPTRPAAAPGGRPAPRPPWPPASRPWSPRWPMARRRRPGQPRSSPQSAGVMRAPIARAAAASPRATPAPPALDTLATSLRSGARSRWRSTRRAPPSMPPGPELAPPAPPPGAAR